MLQQFDTVAEPVVASLMLEIGLTADADHKVFYLCPLPAYSVWIAISVTIIKLLECRIRLLDNSSLHTRTHSLISTKT